MTFQIKRATKRATKLRLATFGPSGAGKTMSALRIATGLGGPIGLIDTERGSASKYSDRWEFDVIELETHKDIDTIVGAIRAFADAGHKVLIIDSLSHAWQELLTEIDKLAATKYKGNTWSAWSQGTPKQRALVDAILAYPGHVIATMRSKTEWTQEKDDRTGKTKPIRVGLAPEQGKGIEYEFDMLMELSVTHVAEVIKDRTGKFQDALIEKPGEDFGRELAAWLMDGAPERPQERPRVTGPTRVPEADTEARETAPQAADDGPPLATPAQLRKLAVNIKEQGLTREQAIGFFTWLNGRDITSSKELTKAEVSRVLDWDADQWTDALADFAVVLEGGPPEVDA
jgi:hypothetical protein